MTVDLVVVGLGYVGLSLAREAVAGGLSVIGHDLDVGITARLGAGRSHVDDVSHADVQQMLLAGFRATADASCLAEADTIVIAVPTPLGVDSAPDLRAMVAASETISDHLRPGVLVVLESTTYPGTTDEVVRPVLERSGLRAGEDFALAFSPERICPGYQLHVMKDTPKVVGGHTRRCAARAAEFYERLVTKVVQAKGTREAEMAKLIENTYRHVNIALVNDLAVLCRTMGIDIWDAIECAASKPYGFHSFRPGPGVGGHCIPIDPLYLSYKARSVGHDLRFVDLAHDVNQRMPHYVVRRAQDVLNAKALPVRGSRVLLLGVAYKPNVADLRETPALPIARRLRELGAHVTYHDPYVAAWSVDEEAVPRAADLLTALREHDLTVLLQDHEVYDLPTIADEARLLFDTCGRIFRAGVEVL
jgi:nucleotide sugar dehydrogenase